MDTVTPSLRMCALGKGEAEDLYPKASSESLCSCTQCAFTQMPSIVIKTQQGSQLMLGGGCLGSHSVCGLALLFSSV